MPPKPLHLARKVLSGGKLNKSNQGDGRGPLTRYLDLSDAADRCKLILTIYIYGHHVRLTAGASEPFAKEVS